MFKVEIEESQKGPQQQKTQSHPWGKKGGQASLEGGERPSRNQLILPEEKIRENNGNAQSFHYSEGDPRNNKDGTNLRPSGGYKL